MRPSKEKIRTELDPAGIHNLETQCALDWIRLRDLEAEKKDKAKEYNDLINPLKKQLDRNSAATKSGILEETRDCFIEVNHTNDTVDIYADEECTVLLGTRPATDAELNAPLDMEFEPEEEEKED